MNKKKILYLSLIVSAFFILNSQKAFSLEIALSGENNNSGGGGRIGVVDMQKIYQISPQTVNAKEDYLKKLEAKKKFLDDKAKELEMVKARIAILDTTTKSDEPSAALADVPASTESHKSMADLKTELQTKEVEYQDARKQAADDLAAFEKNQNQLIFGNIYKALKDLAQEEQVNVIVDKASVLFGAAEIDLTEKLQARIRGF